MRTIAGITQGRATAQSGATKETVNGIVKAVYPDENGQIATADVLVQGQSTVNTRCPNSTGQNLWVNAAVTLNYQRGSPLQPSIIGVSGSAAGVSLANAAAGNYVTVFGTSTQPADISSLSFLLLSGDDTAPNALVAAPGANVYFLETAAQQTSGGLVNGELIISAVPLVLTALPGLTASMTLPNSTLVDLVDSYGLSLGMYRWNAALLQWIRRDVAGGSGSGSGVSPLGPASGDLSGSYPGPMAVTGLQGRPVLGTAPTSGQVLAWNGSAWAPANGSGGGSGLPVSTPVLLQATFSGAPDGYVEVPGANVYFNDLSPTTTSGGVVNGQRTITAVPLVLPVLPSIPASEGLPNSTLVDLANSYGTSLGMYRWNSALQQWIRRDVGNSGASILFGYTPLISSTNTLTTVNPTPSANTTVWPSGSVTVPASNSARRVIVHFSGAYSKPGGNNIRSNIALDGTILTQIESAADGLNGPENTEPTNGQWWVNISGYQIAVPGDNAPHTVAIVYGAQGGTNQTNFEFAHLVVWVPTSQQIVSSLQTLAGALTLSSNDGSITIATTSATNIDLSSVGGAGSGTDPDVSTWVSNATGGGGAISSVTQGAMTAFVQGLKSDGIWSSLITVWVCAGNYAASPYLLKWNSGAGDPNVATYHNFVSADYAETGGFGGLKGDGSTKYADLGTTIPNLSQNSMSVGVYARVQPGSGNASNGLIGSSYAATGNTDRFFLFGVGNGTDDDLYGLGGSFVTSPAYPTRISTGLIAFGVTDTSSTGIFGYIASGSSGAYRFASNTGGQTWQQTGTVNVFRAASTAYTTALISFAFVGFGLTAAQYGLLYARVQTLQRALQRAV